MRILFLSNVFPGPAQPGKGMFNLAMLNALAERNDVSVIAPVAWSDRWRGGCTASSDFRPVGLSPAIEVAYPTFYFPPRIFRERYGDFMWWSLRGELQRTIRRFEPEVVFAYWVHPDGEVAVRAARAHGLPVVLMTGGSDVLVHAVGKRRAVIGRVLGDADAVVTVSKDLKRHVIELGVDKESVHVVRRGVDAGVFHPGDRCEARNAVGIPNVSRLIVAAGRLVEVKAFEVLIEACRLLSERSQGVECRIIGEGPQRPFLQAKIDAARLGNVCRLVGPQSQRELANWFRAADLTVLPSLSEGVPNVLLESMACGTPFVASEVGGIPEIAHPQFDRLVPPGNPMLLVEAIAGLLSRKQSQSQRIGPPSLEQSAAQLQTIFEAAAQRPHEPHAQKGRPCASSFAAR